MPPRENPASRLMSLGSSVPLSAERHRAAAKAATARPFPSRPRAVAGDSAEAVEDSILPIFLTRHQFLKAVDDLDPERTTLCETIKPER